MTDECNVSVSGRRSYSSPSHPLSRQLAWCLCHSAGLPCLFQTALHSFLSNGTTHPSPDHLMIDTSCCCWDVRSLHNWSGIFLDILMLFFSISNMSEAWCWCPLSHMSMHASQNTGNVIRWKVLRIFSPNSAFGTKVHTLDFGIRWSMFKALTFKQVVYPCSKSQLWLHSNVFHKSDLWQHIMMQFCYFSSARIAIFVTINV